jgi:ABC-type multidrug transport system ATPase subunit
MTMGLVRPDEGRIRLFENLAPGASGTMRRISYMLLM